MTEKEAPEDNKRPGYMELIITKYHRSHLLIDCHHKCAGLYEKKHYWLGIPAIVLSAIVGTAVFATLQQNPNLSIQISVGLASMVAAVLTVLQTFLRFNERAEKHRVTGNRYGEVMDELELALVVPPATEEEAVKFISSVSERWARIKEESPNIPQHIWKSSQGES